MEHKTFYSQLIDQDIGYTVYLPPEYEENDQIYPVTYHFHGYRGDECSDIWAMENICRGRQSITVFPNAPCGYIEYPDNDFPIERIIITELIPHIDTCCRTIKSRDGRSLTGWSMGGTGAFYYAVKYIHLFSSVTAYAGTYHHLYYSDYPGVGAPIEKAAELYESMSVSEKYFDRDNLVKLRENADKIRDNLHITLQIGTEDPLVCDNEIMHLYLNSLNIRHDYYQVTGAAHELNKVV